MSGENEKREFIGPADARVSRTVYPSRSDRQGPLQADAGDGAETELAWIAEVQMGYTFRSGLEHDPRGAVHVIQMKDLRDDCIVAADALARVAMDAPSSQQVRVGDIVVRSRGDKATSAIVDADLGCALVAAPLLRVRVTDRRVTPAYLNWYINQPLAQAYLAKRAEGTHMKMISKVLLEALPVLVPTPERQGRIMHLAGLSARERILSAELDELRGRVLAAVMVEYAHGAGHGATDDESRRGSR